MWIPVFLGGLGVCVFPRRWQGEHRAAQGCVCFKLQLFISPDKL